MVKDKNIGYCSISADKISTDIENKKSFENNIIRCISLRDVNSFTMREMPSISDLIVIYKEGFILEDIKENNNLFIFTKYTQSGRNKLFYWFLIKNILYDFGIYENGKLVRFIEFDGIQHFEESKTILRIIWHL